MCCTKTVRTSASKNVIRQAVNFVAILEADFRLAYVHDSASYRKPDLHHIGCPTCLNRLLMLRRFSSVFVGRL